MKEKTKFAVIGAISGGLFKLVYNYFFIYKPNIQSQISLDHLIAYQHDLDPFFLGFGIIGLILGFFYSFRKKHLKNKLLNHVLLISIFTLCGLAYSLWLHLYAASEMLEISRFPLHSIIISLAVGLFVFIFCSGFLSLPNNKKALVFSALFSSVVLVFLFFTIFISRYTTETAIALGLVSYLIVLAIVYITVGYHFTDYFSNILVNILFFSLFFVLLPVTGSLTLILIPFVNIFYLIRIIKSSPKRSPTKESSQSTPKPVFKKRITTTLEWVFSGPSILINCTVFGSIFSILPYLGITKHLRTSEQLSNTNYRKSIFLGLFTFILHFLFFLFYGYAAPYLASSNFITFIISDILIWILIPFIAVNALGHSLFE